MSWPLPRPGLVVRYAYLWAREAREGRDEGAKDRPCAVVLVVIRDDDAPRGRVLPITRSAPSDPSDGLEIPQVTKKRLGLDAERSWVVLTEANDFVWPGPDLRPVVPGDLGSAAYGFLPPGFFRMLRDRLLARYRSKRLRAIPRTE